jgi:hypothetical protein
MVSMQEPRRITKRCSERLLAVTPPAWAAAAPSLRRRGAFVVRHFYSRPLKNDSMPKLRKTHQTECSALRLRTLTHFRLADSRGTHDKFSRSSGSSSAHLGVATSLPLHRVARDRLLPLLGRLVSTRPRQASLSRMRSESTFLTAGLSQHPQRLTKRRSERRRAVAVAIGVARGRSR